MMNDFEPRNLDGIYYRVERNGKFINRCFSDLNSEEQDKFIDGYNDEQLMRLSEHINSCTVELIKDVMMSISTKQKKQSVKQQAKVLRMLGDAYNVIGDAKEKGKEEGD